jgi:hypothetical protein
MHIGGLGDFNRLSAMLKMRVKQENVIKSEIKKNNVNGGGGVKRTSCILFATRALGSSGTAVFNAMAQDTSPAKAGGCQNQ